MGGSLWRAAPHGRRAGRRRISSAVVTSVRRGTAVRPAPLRPSPRAPRVLLPTRGGRRWSGGAGGARPRRGVVRAERRGPQADGLRLGARYRGFQARAARGEGLELLLDSGLLPLQLLPALVAKCRGVCRPYAGDAALDVLGLERLVELLRPR